ncbi:MAG: nitroreductase family protein [Mycoplasmataceae bacterium]|nr:nitroreductase family protein [Mycoplasmataceae bacterium]
MENRIEKFIETLKNRHSDYTLSNKRILKNEEFIDFIEKCLYYHPSAFNVQSTRVVLLLNKHVAKIWSHVINQLPKDFPKLLLDELAACKNGYATMLFYDDEQVTKQASEQYHMSLANFESWAIQSMAMLQINMWNGLTYLGYGVNIQHFNKELDEFARNEFKIPKTWKLLAQMNVGSISGSTKPRTHLPTSKLLFIHK